MGDTEAMFDEIFALHFVKFALHIVSLYIPTSYLLIKASQALRTCGFSTLRWDSNSQVDSCTFQGEARRAAGCNPETILRALETYEPDMMSSTNWSYDALPITVQQVNDL